MSFFKDKKVLVTGGAGFVGINLINRLLRLGAKIMATLHIKEPVIKNERIEYVRCDLTKMEDCKRVVEGIDYVFHCAANTSGALVMKNTPLVHVTPNIVMNALLLEASYFSGVKKFVWLSSSTVYPSGGFSALKEEEMLNSDPEDKYFPVGWMKRYTEILCQMYSQKLNPQMVTVVLRPTNIYGEYDKYDFAKSHMFAATLRKVVERHNPIEVWGTGDDIRDLIYIDDMVDAIILAVQKIDTYHPLNIGYGKGYSVKEILNMMLKIDGYQSANIIFNTAKPTMGVIKLVDITRAEKELGFRPKTSIEEGIAKTIRWYKENMHVTIKR